MAPDSEEKKPAVEQPILTSLIYSLRPYPIKGQQPSINRRNSGDGHLTNRVHICFGCEALATKVGDKLDYTLHRLFRDETPEELRTKRQRRSHGKPRIGRQYTLYTHKTCRDESLRRASDFINRQLQEAISARFAQEGIVA